MITNFYPVTLRQAVGRCLIEIPDDMLDEIRWMKEEDLTSLHHDLGQTIRNEFGLWNNNHALMWDTGEDHADGASMIIIETLWSVLQEI